MYACLPYPFVRLFSTSLNKQARPKGPMSKLVKRESEYQVSMPKDKPRKCKYTVYMSNKKTVR